MLDVQFVITVNNYIVGREETKVREEKKKDLSLLKIECETLTDILYDNCFFLNQQEKKVSRQLIEAVVQSINEQNGNKGHILLIEYKTFMLHNMIDKHNFGVGKKFMPIEGKKVREMVRMNDESIKEVEMENEESEIVRG